ncbi:MAG: hypothetical protein LBG75_01115 [Candidatus Nomurabacteria bacterium]|jgi:hypothetical protein|nr:hypothetical protein [Candidatus Nomurabacteria bacterium]
MSKTKKEDGAARKFARLVTEGPEEYRKKFEGKSPEEAAKVVEDEMDARAKSRAVQRAARHNINNKAIHRPNLGARIFWGVLLLVAAGILGVQAFDVYTFAVNPWWLVLATFLVAFGIATAIGRVWFFTFGSVAGLLTIANYQTDWLPFSMNTQQVLWMWGAAILLSIAFSVLFHRSRPSKHLHAYHDGHTHFDRHNPDKYENVINQDDDSEVFVDVNMGATIKYINTEDFQRAVLNCRLGSIKAYFDNAKVKGDSAIIEVNGFMSGFELYIPKNWRVVDSVSNTMSGVNEKNTPRFVDKGSGKTVTITGSMTMSGVEIIYV